LPLFSSFLKWGKGRREGGKGVERKKKGKHTPWEPRETEERNPPPEGRIERKK